MNNWKKKTILFLISQAVTLFGSTLVQMAIVWYVTLSTGEGAWIAAFTAASYIPQFLISFAGGALADRYSRKALIIGADAGIALVTLAVWFMLPAVSEKPLMLPLLLVMSAIRSLGAGIQTPAVNAVLPTLVPEDSLMRYNGINATMQAVVQFAAPAAAGAVLSVSTLGSVLLIDAATAAVGIGIFAFIALPKQERSASAVSMLADMKSGISYALSDKLLKSLLAVYGAFIFLSVPPGYLAQLYVSRTFGDTYLHLTAVEVTGFLGMMAGGVMMSSWGGFKNRILTLSLALALFGAVAVAMGMTSVFPLYLALMFLYGVPLTAVQTSVTTVIQERADRDMQGRVFGLMGTMYSGFLPLGMLIFGPLADAVSLRFLIIASGALTSLVGAFVLLSDRNRRSGAGR